MEHCRLSVIVPVYNNARDLTECVTAIRAAAQRLTAVEIIVVDDGSTDETVTVAFQLGVRLLSSHSNSGPAAARNLGADHARGAILFFVDADVVVASDVLERVIRTLDARPEIAAVFGSYDAHPRAPGIVSQYRNLLHHFVHQRGNPDASTFWAGCGGIRREVFVAVGGFDARRFRHPSVEDIELGMRLRRAGHRILLDPDLQGTHLKRWRLATVIRNDITRRAMPWAHLILESPDGVPNDLNLRYGQRLSALLVGLSAAMLPLAAWRVEFLPLAAVGLLAVVPLNWTLFVFFRRQRGLRFAAACLPLHALYFLYSLLSFALVWTRTRLGAVLRRSPGRYVP